LAAEHRQDGGIDGSHGAVGGEIAFAGEALTVGERKFSLKKARAAQDRLAKQKKEK
jgi:hypothetical protein